MYTPGDIWELEPLDPPDASEASPEDLAERPPKANVEEAARGALADVIAEPITDLVMLGTSTVEPGSGDAAAGEEIDKLSEGLLDIVDPARLPSAMAEKVASHLTAHLLAVALGPAGVLTGLASWRPTDRPAAGP